MNMKLTSIILKQHIFSLVIIGFAMLNNTLYGKEFSKESETIFHIKSAANTSIFIDNRYGTVKIIPHNEQTIAAKAKITIKANNEEYCKQKLDASNVEMKSNSTNTKIDITTIIGVEEHVESWLRRLINVRGNPSTEAIIKVDIDIYMPQGTSNVKIQNRYGDVILPDLEGQLNIAIHHGRLSAGKLPNPDNRVMLRYCNLSNIEILNYADLDLQYSKLTINTANNLKISSRYSALNIAQAKSVKITGAYDKFSIGNVTDSLKIISKYSGFNITQAEIITLSSTFDNIIIGKTNDFNLNSRYSTVTIDTLQTAATVVSQYGSVNFRNVCSTFKKISFSSRYSDIRVNTQGNKSFNIDLSGTYTDIKIPFDFKKYNNIILKIDKGYKSAITANLQYGSFIVK